MRKMAVLLLCICGLAASCNDDPSGSGTDDSIRGRVTDMDGAGIADALILINYDNPREMRPQTEIGFSLPEPQQVHLWIEDPCDGALIRTVIDSVLSAGQHQIAWNAKDDDGFQVTEGLYIAKIEGDDGVDESELFLFMGPYDGYETTEGLLSFAQTDENGNYRIPQDCLDFGVEIEYDSETYIISREVRIWAIHDGFHAVGSAEVNVSASEGAEVDLTMVPINLAPVHDPKDL